MRATSESVMPKMVELNLKVRLPENFVEAAQKLIDDKKWDDGDINYAFSWILIHGLGLWFDSAVLKDACGDYYACELISKYKLREFNAREINRMMEEWWKDDQ